jgi:anion-transporting  ArsA/GET3 family ATPase
LIVIDTPPTRNALDFLDAPRRLTGFLESRVLRWFLLPYIKAGGGFMRVANIAATTFLRIVKRIIGTEALDDTAEFFRNLEGMYEGFNERAREVASLLKSNVTSFVVVTSPATDSVSEAMFFASRLNESGLPFGALVVNRVHPVYGDEIRVRARQLGKLESSGSTGRLLAKMLRNQEAFMRVVESERSNLATDGSGFRISRGKRSTLSVSRRLRTGCSSGRTVSMPRSDSRKADRRFRRDSDHRNRCLRALFACRPASGS